jgi:methylthioxylose transferase
VVVPAAFTLAGFSWFAGVAGTHTAWAAGGGARARPYAYFLVGDLSVLALLIGPATAVALPTVLGHATALARIRWRGAGREPVTDERSGVPAWTGWLGWPVAAAFVGMIALDLSGVTRGEVERIWIPYAAWTTIAPAVARPPARTLLLAQVATALVIQALARSPW